MAANKEQRLLITNGRLATFGPDFFVEGELIESGAVLIEGDEIAAIGPSSELQAAYPAAERLDAAGKLVMPGNICAHTHFYGAFARGLGIPGSAPSNFPEILEKLWWRLDKALLWDDVKSSAEVCLVNAIRHGTTTLIDHHASPNAINGSLDEIADAVTEAGLRASLCYEVTDRDGLDKAEEGVQENARFVARSKDKNFSPLLAGTMGLHASLTLSEDTLARCKEVADVLGVGFHLHVAEDKADQRDSLKRSGLRVVERLQRAGLLGPKTIAVHCVHLDAYEKDFLRETGTLVVHNPRSNMNNAVGTTDVQGMLKKGITLGLGNDGFSNNMFTEMMTTYLVHKMAQADPRAMPGDQVMQMAYENNAAIASIFWPKPLGQLVVGGYADIILLDYHLFTPLSAGNLPWHILFGIGGCEVTHTICGGKMLMKDRKLLTVDEEAIAARAMEQAKQVWERI